MQQLLNAVGRETVVVNLDPGNDLLPYECAVDVMGALCGMSRGGVCGAKEDVCMIPEQGRRNTGVCVRAC